MAAGDVALNLIVSASTGAAMSGLQGVGKAISDMAGGGVMGKIAQGAVAVAAGLVTIGVAAVKSAGDFQQSMTLLVTSAGESKSAISAVSAGILKMSVDTGTSTQQLGAGMYYIESAGYHGANGLNVLKTAAMGAKTENADLDTVAKALTTVMVDYGMKSTDSAKAMNGLIATVQNGKTNLQELASSMGAVLPIASAMHISFPQVAGSIATMTNAGMSARQAAQNLAHVLVALESPSGVAVTAMKSVGLSAQQVKDALVNQGLPQALQLIEDHVGKQFPAGSVKYETALKDIMGGIVGLKLAAMLTGSSLQTTKDNIAKITAAMKDGSGAVLGWTDIQGNFNFQIDQAKQALNVLMITLGTALLPVVGQAMSAIMKIITAFTDWETKTHGMEAALAAIESVVKSVFGSIVTTLSQTMGTVNKFSPVMLQVGNVLKTAFQSNLPSVLSFISQAFKTLTSSMIAMDPGINLIQALSQHAQELGKWFQSSVIPAIKQAEPGFKNLWQAIAGLLPVISQVAAIVHTTFQKAFDALLPVFEKMIPIIIQLAGMIAGALGSAIKFLSPYIVQAVAAIGKFVDEIAQRVTPIMVLWMANLQDFLKIWKQIWPFLVPILKGIWDEIVGIIQIAWAIVSGIIKIGLDLLSGNWKQVWTDMGDMFQGIWAGIIKYFSGAWETIKGIVVAMVNGIEGFFIGLWDDLTGHSIIPNMIADIIAHFTKMVSDVLSSISGFITNTEKFFSNLGNFFSNWFSTLASNFGKWATSALTMFTSGITSGAKNVMSAVTNIGTGIANILGFHSAPTSGPLSKSDQWMPNMVTMMANGVTATSPKVTTSVNTMATGINSQFTNMNSQVSNSVNNLNSTVTNGFQKMSSNVQSSTQNINSSMSGLQTSIGNQSNSINTSITNMSKNVKDGLTSINSQVQTTSVTVPQSMKNITSSVQQSGPVVTGITTQIVQDFIKTQSGATTSSKQIVVAVNTIAAGAATIPKYADAFQQGSNEMSASAAEGMSKANKSLTTGAKQSTDTMSTMKAGIATALSDIMKLSNTSSDAQTALFKGMISGAKDAATGLAGIMSDMLKNTESLVGQMASSIKSVMGFSGPPALGPLHESDKWMPHMVDMLTEGLNAGIPKLASTAKTIASTLTGVSSGISSSIAGNISVPGGTSSSLSGGTTHITIQLDSKVLADATLPRIAKEIRIQGGVRKL